MKILHDYPISDEQLQEFIAEENKIIYIKDIREYFNGCVHGWRSFVKIHNLDWKKYAIEGIPADILSKTNDAMALNLIKYVYLRDKNMLNTFGEINE